MALGDGTAAAESYERDVVILDIGLLVESGYEAARHLLQNTHGSAVVAEAKPNPAIALPCQLEVSRGNP